MKYETTIPQRYELGERLIYAMFVLCTVVGIVAAFGCGDAQEQGFDDGQEDDQVLELGEASEALGSKFSPGYTYGIDQASLTNCTISPGGNPCILPGRTTIRYRFDGTDECPSGTSWKYQTERGLLEMHSNQFGMPFTVVADSVNPSVIFKRGSCPGTSQASQMSAFICVNWGSLVPVTENQFGTYVRVDNPITVTLDVDDMRQRASGGSPCAEQNGSDLHQLLEHAGHIAGAIPYGQAMYPTHKSAEGSTTPAFLTPEVASNTNGGSVYDTQTISTGVLCRVASWSNGPITGSFVPLAGSCVN